MSLATSSEVVQVMPSHAHLATSSMMDLAYAVAWREEGSDLVVAKAALLAAKHAAAADLLPIGAVAIGGPNSAHLACRPFASEARCPPVEDVSLANPNLAAEEDRP